MRIFVIAGCALALTACASSNPRIVSATQSGITYRVAGDQVSTAENAAKDYCRGRGGHARLDRVSPVGKKVNASFFCR